MGQRAHEGQHRAHAFNTFSAHLNGAVDGDGLAKEARGSHPQIKVGGAGRRPSRRDRLPSQVCR